MVVPICLPSEYNHKYNIGDPVTIWVNKVDSYNNIQETFNYYRLHLYNLGTTFHINGVGLEKLWREMSSLTNKFILKLEQILIKENLVDLSLVVRKYNIKTIKTIKAFALYRQ